MFRRRWIPVHNCDLLVYMFRKFILKLRHFLNNATIQFTKTFYMLEIRFNYKMSNKLSSSHVLQKEMVKVSFSLIFFVQMTSSQSSVINSTSSQAQRSQTMSTLGHIKSSSHRVSLLLNTLLWTQTSCTYFDSIMLPNPNQSPENWKITHILYQWTDFNRVKFFLQCILSIYNFCFYAIHDSFIIFLPLV